MKYIKFIFSGFIVLYSLFLFSNGIFSSVQDANVRALYLEALCLILLVVSLWSISRELRIITLTLNIVIIGSDFVRGIYLMYDYMFVISILFLLIFIFVKYKDH